MSIVGRHVYFEGRVQGVGFRFTTRHMAQKFQVTGFVRNLPDGRVEVVVEGTAEEVEAFVGAVQKEMTRYIFDTKITTEPATGEFGEFGVKF